MSSPTPTRGPCEPWEPVWCCDLSTASPAITGSALLAATEVLYQLSAQQFGICQFDDLRPCRQDCADGWWWGGGFGGLGQGGGSWWEWGSSWPRPALIGGAWFNLTCGGCRGSCSCTELSVALLPSPVAAVVSVKLNGETLPASGYRVDNFRELVRLGGQTWPICQDMTLADTELDTWSVSVQVGQAVPQIGKLAVGELACEIIKACTGAPCAIPKNATTVTRQGITIDFPTYSEMLRDRRLGLRWCDMFIAAYNPEGLQSVPMVFDVDEPGGSYRRVGT